MTRRALIGMFVATFATACATGPSGPPPFDPVGTYQYSADAEGMVVSGTMVIEGSEGAYGGSLQSNMFPPMAINSVTVTGQAVTIQIAGPEGPLLLEMVVTDNAFEGTWAMAGMGGPFSGTKTN